MLRMIGEFSELPIFSIRTSDVVGTLLDPIINPDGLKIIAFYAYPLRQNNEHILSVEDIREVTPGGIIVDDEDNLMELDDLVRIQNIIDLDFELPGKKVETQSHKKMGKVQNFAIDDITWNIQKLYAGRSIVKDFTQTGRVIDRSQIYEVTNKRIVIKDASEKIKTKNRAWSTNQATPEELA